MFIINETGHNKRKERAKREAKAIIIGSLRRRSDLRGSRKEERNDDTLDDMTNERARNPPLGVNGPIAACPCERDKTSSHCTTINPPPPQKSPTGTPANVRTEPSRPRGHGDRHLIRINDDSWKGFIGIFSASITFIFLCIYCPFPPFFLIIITRRAWVRKWVAIGTHYEGVL